MRTPGPLAQRRVGPTGTWGTVALAANSSCSPETKTRYVSKLSVPVGSPVGEPAIFSRSRPGGAGESLDQRRFPERSEGRERSDQRGGSEARMAERRTSCRQGERSPQDAGEARGRDGDESEANDAAPFRAQPEW